MKKIIILSSIFIIVLFSNIAFAHPGGTDGNGGHYNHATGEYHYHHGYSAHQHENGICPYDFEDQSFYDDLTTNYQPETNLPMGPEEPYIKNEKSLVQFGGISMETFIPILIAIVLFSFSLFFFIRSSRNQPNTNKKKRQKLYTDRETTPLIFHETYVYAMLPLGTLYGILQFIIAFFSSSSDSTYYMVFYLVLVPLNISVCYLLSKFRPAGWYLNSICLAIDFISSLLLIGMPIVFYSVGELLLLEMISPIIRIIISVLIFIYYYKRKSLFIPSKERKIEETTIAPLNQTINNSKNTIDVSTPPQGGKTRKTTVLLLILLLISIGGNVFCFFRITLLSEMYDESRKNAKAYNDAYINQKLINSKIQSEYEFYHQYAVIVEEGSNTYHCYGCEKLENKSFYIFNIENAYAQGYYPCTVCMKTSSN